MTRRTLKKGVDCCFIRPLQQDVAVERTWMYLQRPDKITICILIGILR